MTTTSSSVLTEADERAIREVVERAQPAQGDAEVLPALHTAGTVIFNLVGRRVLGRDAFVEAMAAALRSWTRRPDGQPLRAVSTASAARRPLTRAPCEDGVSRWSPATNSPSPRATGLRTERPAGNAGSARGTAAVCR